MAYTLVLSSGGIESAVATARELTKGGIVRSIHFDIGHRAKQREYHSVNRIGTSMNVSVKKVDFPGLQDMFSGIMDAEMLADEGDRECQTEVSVLPGLIELAILYGRQSEAEFLVVGLTAEHCLRIKAANKH